MTSSKVWVGEDGLLPQIVEASGRRARRSAEKSVSLASRSVVVASDMQKRRFAHLYAAHSRDMQAVSHQKVQGAGV